MYLTKLSVLQPVLYKHLTIILKIISNFKRNLTQLFSQFSFIYYLFPKMLLLCPHYWPDFPPTLFTFYTSQEHLQTVTEADGVIQVSKKVTNAWTVEKKKRLEPYDNHFDHFSLFKITNKELLRKFLINCQTNAPARKKKRSSDPSDHLGEKKKMIKLL